MSREQAKNEPQQGGKRIDRINLGEVVPAVVEEIVGRTGFRGEITQVKVMVKA